MCIGESPKFRLFVMDLPLPLLSRPESTLVIVHAALGFALNPALHLEKDLVFTKTGLLGGGLLLQ